MSDTESLPSELMHLEQTSRQNGYIEGDVAWTLKQQLKMDETCDMDEIRDVPSCPTVAGNLERLLGRYHTKVIFKPSELQRLLHLVKYNFGLTILGIIRVPCDLGLSYIGKHRGLYKTDVVNTVLIQDIGLSSMPLVCCPVP